MTDENKAPEEELENVTEPTETEDVGEVEEDKTDAPEPEPVATTEEGVVIDDPKRANRKLADWETKELLAFLKGELKNVPNNLQPGIIKEYRRREDLPSAWSDQEVMDYFRQDMTPPQTESGVWINDVTRANRSPADWTDAELVAWVDGHIEPRGKGSEKALSRELVSRHKLSANPDDIKSVLKEYRHKHAEPAPSEDSEAKEPVVENAPAPKAANVAKPEGALSAMNVSFIDTTLQRYIETVALNKQLSEEEGGHAQRQLDSLFQYVMRLEGKALKEGLNRVNAFINKHRDGVFSPSNAYRFVHLLKGNGNHQAQHVNLIELFLMTGDQNQARRQQVDIRHMLKELPNAQIEILVDYFKNHAKV